MKYKTPKKPSIEPSLHNVRILINSNVKPDIEEKQFVFNGHGYPKEYPTWLERELYDLAVLEGFKKSGLKEAIHMVIGNLAYSPIWMMKA